MELPNGIKILTIVSANTKKERGAWVWRKVHDLVEGKPKYNANYPHVVDDTNGTHIYAVFSWPFGAKMKTLKYNLEKPANAPGLPNPKGNPEIAFREKYGREPVRDNNGNYEALYNQFIDDNNHLPNIKFQPNQHIRLPSQDGRGDYLARANEKTLEIMTSSQIPEINQAIQIPMRFFSVWNDVINYINTQGYLELFANNVHSELLNLAGGRRRTQRGRRKKRTRRRRKSRRKKRRKSRRKKKR